jgi:mannose-1-phosphate guanylyltransferase
MKAMIMAAGYGTRLGILSNQKPKPMLPVGNIPLVVYSIEMLKKVGITEIMINVHHKGDKLEKFLRDGKRFGVNITWSKEEGEILGTGGGIKKIASFFGSESAVICNGKVVTTLDLKRAIDFHKSSGSLGTMVLREDPNASKWGSIGTDKTGKIISMLGLDSKKEKTEYGSTMFTGISILEKEFIDFLPQEQSCVVRQGWLPLFRNNSLLGGYTMADGSYWWEHSTPERYLQGNLNLFKNSLLSSVDIGLSTGISTLPPHVDAPFLDSVIAGKHIQFGKGVTIGKGVIIGDSVKIAPGITVEESIIWPGSVVTQNLKRAIATPCGIVFVDSDSESGFTGPALKKDK